MEINEIQNALDELRTRQPLQGLFDFDNISESIEINEAKMAEPGFWDNQEKAQKLIMRPTYRQAGLLPGSGKDLTDEETALELCLKQTRTCKRPKTSWPSCRKSSTSMN